jgi:hydroxymethylpyrimidine kinase/phosphomethylpyrimidine kinase/thiamine-phosphate diphosphorylase
MKATDSKPLRPNTSRPILWSIAASDSGGGAGIQADLNTFHSLNNHGCTIITAITAQNSLSVDKIIPIAEADLDAQWQALADDMAPAAIKIGLLAQPSAIQWLSNRLKDMRSVFCVWDPVLKASTGATLLEQANEEISAELIDPLLRQLDLITPNLSEAQILTGITINRYSDIEQAAQQLLKRGVGSVLIKGGHSFDTEAKSNYCRDYFASQENSFWLSHKKQDQPNHHGTGCTLSSAIASFIAQGHSLSDSIVLANRFIQQSLRLAAAQGQGAGPVWQAPLENHPVDFSALTTSAQHFDDEADHNPPSTSFPSAIQLDQKPHTGDHTGLGLYAIVNNLKDLQRLLAQGVDTLQWRVKTHSTPELEPGQAAIRKHKEELQQAIQLCAQYKTPLYVNDDWQLALECKAYGIHLGQEDLANISQTRLMQIKAQGLRLGISCHNETELAFAHSLKPSYLAFGPIFTPKSKVVDHPPLGLKTLQEWQNSYGQIYPTTCIGGIELENMQAILATGIKSIAVISALSGPQKSILFIDAFAKSMPHE